MKYRYDVRCLVAAGTTVELRDGDGVVHSKTFTEGQPDQVLDIHMSHVSSRRDLWPHAVNGVLVIGDAWGMPTVSIQQLS